MANEHVIPLSRSSVKALKRNLKALARELQNGHIEGEVERAMCRPLAQEVKGNIASITDLDGNYAGGEDPESAVDIEVAYQGHEVVWRGEQIAYLEFGTGAKGAATPYKGRAMGATGYHPDPLKKVWYYPDVKSGETAKSFGLAPYAPMFAASGLMRSGVLTQKFGRPVVVKEWNSAIMV